MLSTDELRKQIAAFCRDFSIEATPHDAEKLDSFREVLRPGTHVYMAHPPGVPLQEIVRLAGRLQQLGFTAVPHVIARKLDGREQLENALRDLRELGVAHALVVAGDLAVANNAFNSSLEVLQTGLFQKYGFREVGVAGHPEGSPAIGEERAEQAMLGKAAYARESGLNVYFATQFGFEPDAVAKWEAATTAAGVTLPIHVGMAGPASIRQLVKFAMLCGIGASARMLTTRAGAMANLLRTQAPDDVIVEVARHRAANPSSRIVKPHFFCFGGVMKTARWVNAVVAGKFVLNDDATGFRVEDGT